jgi:hypothetical protein
MVVTQRYTDHKTHLSESMTIHFSMMLPPLPNGVMLSND